MVLSTKESITYNEMLMVVGLLTIANRKLKEMEDIEESLRFITGEINEYGHCSDAVFTGYTVKDLLTRLNLKVDKKKAKKNGN